MGYTIQDLLEFHGREYEIRLVCAEAFAGRELSWVENLDGVQKYDFLTGGELVILSSLKEREIPLREHISLLKAKHCSAVLLQVEESEAPCPQARELFEEEKLPLLICVGKKSLHTLAKLVCRAILQTQLEGFDAGQLLKSMIFYPREAKQHYKELEERGFELQGNFVVLVFNIHFDKDEPDCFLTDFKFQQDKCMKRLKLHYGLWIYEGAEGRRYVLVVNSARGNGLDEITAQLQAALSADRRIRFSIGVGPKCGTLSTLPESFRRALRTERIAEKENRSLVCYDDLGIDKILLAADNAEVLRDYYKEVLGELIAYDANNGTDYIKVLRLYLENEGSIQRVADLLFVHRNTINYKMNRIREIMQVEIGSLTVRFQLMLAVHIGEILD